MIFINKLYIVFTVCIVYLLLGSNNKEVVIPKDSLRFRIISNSNELSDQNTKLKVKTNLQKILPNIIDKTSNIIETEEKIRDNMSLIQNNIRQTLDKEGDFSSFNISLGKNYFPEKEFYGVKYPEGNYESLVIGDNWWCVLFPPLCLVEAEEHTDVEYKFFVKEIIDKYM